MLLIKFLNTAMNRYRASLHRKLWET